MVSLSSSLINSLLGYGIGSGPKALKRRKKGKKETKNNKLFFPGPESYQIKHSDWLSDNFRVRATQAKTTQKKAKTTQKKAKTTRKKAETTRKKAKTTRKKAKIFRKRENTDKQKRIYRGYYTVARRYGF